jgi:hypothetical protein
MSDRNVERWEEQAEFMRKHGATHGEWVHGGFVGEEEIVVLTKLTLAPQPAARSVAAVPTAPPKPQGVAARLMRNHEIQYAHSSVRPPLRMPTDVTDVPRAVSAKRGSSDGASKAQKRTA